MSAQRSLAAAAAANDDDDFYRRRRLSTHTNTSHIQLEFSIQEFWFVCLFYLFRDPHDNFSDDGEHDPRYFCRVKQVASISHLALASVCLSPLALNVRKFGEQTQPQIEDFYCRRRLRLTSKASYSTIVGVARHSYTRSDNKRRCRRKTVQRFTQ